MVHDRPFFSFFFATFLLSVVVQETLEELFVALALCHSVQISSKKSPGSKRYQASSPDEQAFVEAAARSVSFLSGFLKFQLFTLSLIVGKEKNLTVGLSMRSFSD